MVVLYCYRTEKVADRREKSSIIKKKSVALPFVEFLRCFTTYMTTFRTFEEIQAWQESRKLVRSVRAICKQEMVRKDFTFIDQITRAARSVSANIAEGNDSLNVKDFVNFLGYAKRSAAEVRSHLYDAFDEKYISKQEFDALNLLADRIGKMIARLIQYLHSLHQKPKRIKNSQLASTRNP